jgi:fibronectin-binding autotransporter adhesin
MLHAFLPEHSLECCRRIRPQTGQPNPNTMKPNRQLRACASTLAGSSLILASLAAGLTPAHAQSSFLWDGGDGASLLWSTPGNWNPDGAPANSFTADLIFGGVFNTGSVGSPLVNDLTTGTLTNLTFLPGAGSFYLSGNAVTNRGNLTNSSGVAQSVNFGIILGTNTPTTTTPHIIDTGLGSITNGGTIAAPAGNSTSGKIGPGTLVFNSPLTNLLGNGTPGGTPFVPAFYADAGTVIFDGGPTSLYSMTGEGAFGRAAPTGNTNITAILNSGTVAGTSWIAIGRGNGVGDVVAQLILNGSSAFKPVNFSGCYNAGDGTRRPWGVVVQNGTTLFQTFNNNNNNNWAESPGSFLRHTLNDSSTLIVGGGTNTSNARMRLGIAGRAVLKQTSPTGTVTFGQTHIGDAAGGAGAFYNRGIFSLMSGASVDHFSIGSASGALVPANNSFGYYLNDSTTLVGLKEIGVGGSGGGNGMLEVNQGTVNVTNWITICRFGTATNYEQTAELLVRGGVVNAPNVAQFSSIWSGSATQYAVVDVNSGGKIGSLGTASAVNLANSANANATSLLTVSSGGVLEVGRIFGGQAAPLTVVNLNGGILNAIANQTAYLGANLDGVYLHAGGVTFDTRGFNVGVLPQLQAPLDQGITAISVATPGGGYIGRPIVRITGGGGQGATAIAEWDEAAGTVTGITMTCTGSGYYEAPTVSLVGGGFTNAATLGVATLGSAPSGGLTKSGAGTLTLTGGSTYTGPTVINGGTLSVQPALTFPASAGALTLSNGALAVDCTGGFYSYPAGATTFGDNATNTFNYGTVFANPFTPGLAVNGNLSAPGTGIVINVVGYGLQNGQFPLISYTGLGPVSLANFSLGPLPPGVVANLVNNTGAKTIDLNITASGQNLAWYGLQPDGVSVSTNWDITLTTNWVAVGTTMPALRYQEYTSAGNTLGDPVRFDDMIYNDFVNPLPTNIFLTTQLRPFIVTVDSTLPYSFGGPGWLSGLGSLVKTNSGSLTIGTSNDYTGGTYLSGGSLIIGNNAGLGAPAGLLALSGGALQMNGNLASTRPITVGVDSPFNAAAGVTAVFGSTFGGTSRLLLQDAGTVSITNNNRLQFHVQKGTLLFDNNARITNTTSFSSVGLTTGDNATMIVRSNATFEINQDFNIADINDARGRLDIQNNAIIRTLNLWLGKNNTCTGLVYQTGGILTNHLTGGTDWRLGGNSAAGNLTFGGYYLSGGRVDVQKNFQIGAYGTGEMLITGGVVNQWTGYPAVGRFTNAIGLLTVTGGQFNQLSTAAFLILGENGTGTLTLGGTGVVTLTNNLRLGGAGGSGTLVLNSGGRLVAPGIQLMADGTATANLNGGTLQPNVNNSTFMQGLTTASVLGGGAVIDTAGKDVTIAQPLLDGGGGGGLTKSGAGTLTLSGASTYTGPTAVNAGRVFMTPAFAGSGAVTVADNATFGVQLTAPGTAIVNGLTLGTAGASSLDFSLGTNSNPTAAVLDCGALAVNGTCSIRIAGRFTVGTFPLVKYTGALGGSGAFNPVVAGAQGLVASLSNHVAGSTLYVTISSLGPGIVWTGTNSAPALTNLWDLNATTNWTVNGSPTYYAELTPPGDAVTFDDSGSGVVRLSNSASPATLVITNAVKAYSFTGSGRIAGPTGLTKQGAATATLGLAGNDYVGDTLIQGGILQLGTATAIPDGAGRGNVVVSTGSALDLNGNSETINGLGGTGDVNNSSGTAATLTLGAGDSSSAWNGTLNNTGSGGIALTKVGAGTNLITGTNYLNAAVQAGAQFNGGVVIITNSGLLDSTVGEIWLGQNAATGTVVVAGGTLRAANWIAIGRNNAAGMGTLVVNSGTVEKAGGNNIVLGSLGGTGAIIVNGGQVLNNGMLWLGENTGANGTLKLNGGLIQATQVRPNGTTPNSSVAWFSGGTLQASAASADFIQSTAWVQSGGLVFDSGGFDVTFATSALQEDPASPGGGLVKTGAGTLYLNTANTYTGSTRVTAGTLAGTGGIMGSLAVEAGGNLAPGQAATLGTFTLGAKPMTLQGNATFRIRKVSGAPESDSLAGISTANYSGTLTVSNLTTEPLVIGDSFQLFSASGASGNFAAIVGSPGVGLAYQFTPASGLLSIVEGTATNPTNISYSFSSGTLTLTWPADHLGWILQSQTNSLNVGISNNWVDIPGSGSSTQAVIPVNPANPAVFYRLRMP